MGYGGWRMLHSRVETTRWYLGAEVHHANITTTRISDRQTSTSTSQSEGLTRETYTLANHDSRVPHPISTYHNTAPIDLLVMPTTPELDRRSPSIPWSPSASTPAILYANAT